MINKKLFITLMPFLLCACGEKSESKNEKGNKEQNEQNLYQQVKPTNQQGNNNTNLNKKNPTDTDKPQNLNNNTDKPSFSSSKKQDKIPTGLNNLGVSCYLNSSLQQLFNIKVLKDEVEKIIKNDTTMKSLDDDSKKIIKALQEMFKGMSSDFAVFNPGKSLLSDLGYKGKQEDASEFCLGILNFLIYNCKNKIIKNEFSFYTKSESSSESPIPETLFLLPLVQNSLESCLNTYFSSENLTGNNHANVEKKLFAALPNNLIIQLIRYTDTYSKDHKKVEFPLELKIDDKWCTNDCKEQNKIYNLTGVIVHSGELNNGHYWSYVKKGNDWYECNDTSVSKVNMNNNLLQKLYGDDEKKDSACILFYSKKS